jgi:hypothetical protein
MSNSLAVNISKLGGTNAFLLLHSAYSSRLEISLLSLQSASDSGSGPGGYSSDYPSWQRRQPQAARPNLIHIGPANTGRQTCKLGAAVHHKALGPRGRARPNACRLSRTLTSSPAVAHGSRDRPRCWAHGGKILREKKHPPLRHCGRLGGGTVHSPQPPRGWLVRPCTVGKDHAEPV